MVRRKSWRRRSFFVVEQEVSLDDFGGVRAEGGGSVEVWAVRGSVTE